LKSTVTKRGNFERVVEVDVSEEELTPHFDKLYQKYRKRVKLEGFRKGKVPLSLIKRLYGEAIKSEAIDDVVQSVFSEVRQKEDLKPVAPAKLEDIDYNSEDGLHFKAVVEVVPDIELKKYTGLSVEREVYQVEERDVNLALEDIRERLAVMQPVEGPAEEGYFVLADFQQLDHTGVPIIGKKFDDRLFPLNKDENNKELSEQLIGIQAGESRKVNLPVSNDGDEEAKTEFYQVTVKEIKEKQLPDLDDDLAKDMGKFESLDALKEDIRSRLTRQTEADSKRRLKHNLIDELLKNNSFDLPESMVSGYLDTLIESASANSNRQIDEEKIRQEYRPMAVWNLKWQIAKDKLTELENIVLTDEEKDKFIARMAEEQNVDENKIRSSLKKQAAKDRFKDDALEDLVVQFLEKNAKIKEKKISWKDLERNKDLAVAS